jgi:hypothetical protein
LRNKRFAHYDLALAVDGKAATVEEANKENMNAALKSLSVVLNAIESHYFKSGTVFEAIAAHQGAVALLYVLDDGVRKKEEREKNILDGKILDSDLQDPI